MKKKLATDLQKLANLKLISNSEIDEHPGPEELIDYKDNLLSEEHDQKIRNHVSLCSYCAKELLALSKPFEIPETPRESTSSERDTAEHTVTATRSAEVHALWRVAAIVLLTTSLALTWSLFMTNPISDEDGAVFQVSGVLLSRNNTPEMNENVRDSVTVPTIVKRAGVPLILALALPPMEVRGAEAANSYVISVYKKNEADRPLMTRNVAISDGTQELVLQIPQDLVEGEYQVILEFDVPDGARREIEYHFRMHKEFNKK